MKRVNSLLFIALLAGSAVAQAQMYKWVGPDGKVTYSDAPPPAGAKTVENKTVSSGGAGADLPFELAQAAKNHPVTLYTGEQCAPCDQGRSLLKARGIPFAEKTVASNADIERLRQVGGEKSLPFLTIGRSKQKGFAQSAWNAALTAAGYPESNKLPKTYRYPQAESAAPSARPMQANHADTGKPAEEARADDLPPPTGNAPPGFRF